MSDSFFLLAWFQIEIDAAVMILAEFRMQRREHFSQRFAMPGHQFRKEKRGNRGVALRQVEVGTDAAAFLAAYQNVLFEHQFADVFEADGCFVAVSAELRWKSSGSKPAADPCMGSNTKRNFASRKRFQSTSFSSASRYGARGSRG